MKLRVLVADPAKNITILVLTPLARRDYTPIARALLKMKELGGEQVGFICPPQGGEAGRLEMMGGEFCGNASRSFGLYLARKSGGVGECSVPISISGCGETLEVRADTLTGFAEVEMPQPLSLGTLAAEGFGELFVCHFEGISHLIAPDIPASEESFYKIKRAAERAFSCDALGIMFYARESRSLTPAVYVRGTDSLVFESSCGSGCTALALWLSRSSAEGEFSFDIAQPGGTLRIHVSKGNGLVKKLELGGIVRLGEEREIELSL